MVLEVTVGKVLCWLRGRDLTREFRVMSWQSSIWAHADSGLLRTLTCDFLVEAPKPREVDAVCGVSVVTKP